MKKLTISKDIVPVAEFKTGISKYLKSLKETGHPVIITQNGRPAGVVITPAEYDNLTYKSLFIESVSRGLSDIKSGESYSTEELIKRIKSARVSRKQR